MAAIPSFHLPIPVASRAPARARTLLIGCILSVAAGLMVSRWAAPREIDPDLVTLLRAMAAIKAALVVAAIGIVSWRFGLTASPPITTRTALVYGASVAAMSFATALIWMTAFIGLAALVFHAGLFAALINAWRDDRVTAWRPTH